MTAKTKIKETPVNRLPAKKHGKINGELNRRIKLGLYVDQMPPVAQLAKEFDVNALTIRKALHNLEKEGAIERIERVGTFVRHKRRIAVLFMAEASSQDKNTRHYRNPVYAPLLDGIIAEAEKRHYFVVSCVSGQEDREFILALRNEVDGFIILFMNKAYDVRFYSNLKDFPWVRAMGVPIKGLAGRQFSYENFGIGAMAADYLSQKKCRHFVYVGHAATDIFRERMEEFKTRVASLGGNFTHINLVVDGMNDDERFAAVRKGLEALVKKGVMSEAGLYLSADIFALPVYQAMYSLGITPVKDVPVIAGDFNTSFSNGITPKPAYIDIRMPEIGVKAAEALFGIIDGRLDRAGNDTVLLKPALRDGKMQ